MDVKFCHYIEGRMQTEGSLKSSRVINLVSKALQSIVSENVCIHRQGRLRMFKSSVQGRIFGMKREEPTGGRRNFYEDELCNLYTSPYRLLLGQSK
jgi:hypothetical protein